MKIVLKDDNNCTGCTACAQICKQNAISMVENSEGFVFPHIDYNKCVNCGACSKICATDVSRHSLSVGNTYSYQAYDRYLLFNSTSGGMVPTIANLILEQGGVYLATVYSAERKEASWKFITQKKDIKNASGSKYFQIPLLKNTIDELILELNNRRVLFVGTPCQVAAVKKIVPLTLQENLVTIDLVCGGVQSFKLEKLYLQFLEKKQGTKIISHKYRNKDRGWKRKYVSMVEFANGDRQLMNGSEDMFLRTYANGSYLRRSCYSCEYVGRERVGDITVGDCWGIENKQSVLYEKEMGISLVGFNTQKALDLFALINVKGLVENVSELILLENKPLNRKNVKPKYRNISYMLLDKLPFELAIDVVCYKYLIKRLIGRS